jgi:endo-1,4-beta-xylanase
MSHYAGKVYAWDVVNEAFSDDGTMRSTVRPAWHRIRGKGQNIEQALNWARAADPNAKLFYNDYNRSYDAKSDAIYAMAQISRTAVPLDGVGFNFTSISHSTIQLL